MQKLSSLRTAPGPYRRAVIARTTIEAAPDAVWDVLTDFFGYREWSPLLRSVQGRPHVGSVLTIQTFSIASRPVRSQAQVTVVKAGHDLRWVGRRIASGLLDEEHRFALRQSVLTWLVRGPAAKVGENFEPGSLAGNYAGVGAEATVGIGGGVNALVGGGAQSFSLQPVSVQVQTGISVAAGVQQTPRQLIDESGPIGAGCGDDKLCHKSDVILGLR